MNLAQLHHDVAFGRAGGRIIWQPRIGCWYSDKRFAGEALPAPFTDMTPPDMFRELACSDRLYGTYNPCFVRIEPESVTRTEKHLNDTDTQTTIHTPVGTQVRVDRRSPNNPGSIHVKWPIETEDELKVAAWIAENTAWQWDAARYERGLAEVGDLGAPTMFLPRMNVQDLYINTMGVERATYAMLDWPDTVAAYFRAQEESHDRLIDVINASPVDIINFGENLHAGTLSPALFERHHLPACRRRCERLHTAGKFCSSHWDGDCRPLLKYARDTGLDGIEAITPLPQGDVTLEETREALGDMTLLDGIPAIYFDHTFPEDVLIACAHKCIGLFAPNLILGISDELSSHGDIERVRLVGRIVDEYNAQFD